MRKGLGFHNRHSAGGFQPISLFTGGVQGAWYDPSDSTTLFSDRAGTTPCAIPGAGTGPIPVGAMLDERATAYSVYFDGSGDYLSVPNSTNFTLDGDFTAEFWVYNTNVAGSPSYFTIGDSRSAQNGLLVYYSAATSNLRVYSNSTALIDGGALSNNQWLHVAVVRSGAGSNNLRLYVNGTTVGQVTNNTTFTGVAANGVVIAAEYAGSYGSYGRFYMSNFRIVKGTAVYTSNFTPPTAPLSPISGTSLLTCGTSWTGNPAITKNGDARVDGLNPFTASPVGNHAIAANDTTARPELSARVNLLTYSEQFDNAAWTAQNATVANTTATTDPLGGNTADILTDNAVNTEHRVFQTPTNTAGTYVWSFWAKANTLSWLHLGIPNAAGSRQDIYFDVGSGALGTVPAGYTATITSAGNGWWRCTVTGNTQANAYFVLSPSTANNVQSYAGTGQSLYIWGADLRLANIGTTIPSYQRVADQYTYDAVGFPRYLAFNGTNSAMSTPASIPFATVTSDGQARRNLLSVPALFADPTWQTAFATKVSTTQTDPNGGSTAALITIASGGAFYQNATLTGGSGSFSVYVKKPATGGATAVRLTTNNQVAWSTGLSTKVTLTSDWQRVVLSGALVSSGSTMQVDITCRDAASTIDPDCIGDVLVAFAQLETSLTATAFQNIGTDKATVFAGVRKLSDADAACIAELSTAASSNNGAFAMFSSYNGSLVGPYWSVISRGTSNSGWVSVSGINPPVNGVLTGVFSIPDDQAILRVNGAQAASSATDQGTGNFGTYPLYVGARSPTSARLTGNIYSLIVAGSAVSAANITATETWVNNKVGGVY